ncbi:MAG TPA: serine hydrolase domain-containing protein [Mucilaginibacter sp.]|jgi:CubicO group peptidase (beta-lactamase class C family)|nr:serine hydrolase domain-containing protein [Mucilaginibacter sp.]
MKKVIFIAFLLFLVPGIKAQVRTDNPGKTKLDSLVRVNVQPFMDAPSRMALSIGIYKHGQFKTYNYGETEKGSGQLPSSTTIYEIGSISKTFTAMLLAQAVLDKKLNLEDDIRTYLKGAYPNLAYQGRPIKIIHLANHTSGLPHDIFPDTIASMKNASLDAIVQLYDEGKASSILKGLRQVTLDTLPGYKVNYSNAGVQLLGLILENLYHQSYGELVKKYITGPFNMKQTRLLFDHLSDSKYIKGYDGSGHEMPHLLFEMPGAAGGILSNVQDMLLYIRANALEKNDAIRLAHQVTIKTDSLNGIGLCWEEVNRKNGLLELWHSGGMPGFSSFCIVYPKQKMAIVGLTNQSGLQGDLSNMLRAILLGGDSK